MHDGSHIILHKLSKDYDPTNKLQAVQAIHAAIAEGKFLTGVIYYNPNSKECCAEVQLCDVPLTELSQDDLQPPIDALERINADMMKKNLGSIDLKQRGLSEKSAGPRCF